MRRHRITCILLALALETLAGCGGGGRELEREAQAPRPPAPPAPLGAGSHPAESLSPGSSRSYALSLQAGQYLELAVQQLGVDVAVTVRDPAGRLLLRVDSPNADQGPEELCLVADTNGRHVLAIESSQGEGRYEIRVEPPRVATEADRKRAAAAAAYSRARLLQGDSSRATEAAVGYREAAKLWGEVADDVNAAWALFWLGRLYQEDPGRRRESAEAFARALDLYRRVGNKRQQAITLHDVGKAWEKKGDVERASRCYEQALDFWEELEEPSEQAAPLNDLARVRVRQGRVQEAIDLYARSVEAWQKKGDGSEQATTRTNLGQLYASLGEGPLALDQYRRALALLDRQPDFAKRVVTLNKLGDVLLWMEGPEPALKRLREALELRRRLHDTFGQAVTFNSIGHAQQRANRPREALEAFKSAVGIFSRLEARSAQAVALVNLGIAYERLGRLGRARESYERGLELDPARSEMTAVFGLARVARLEGRLDEAERWMDRTLELVEGVRGQVWRPDLRASYQAARQEYYAFLIDLLAERHRREPERGHGARAFAVSELARARSLLDLLSAARSKPDPEELRRLDGLSRRINDRHLDLLASPEGIASGDLEGELAGLLESWRQAKASAQGPLPALPPSLSLLQVQSRLLDEETLLLEYFLGEARSYVWAVTSSDARFVATLPGRAQIEEAARHAYERLTESHYQTGEAGARQAAASLSEMILGPVADLLDRPRLVVVAHGALQIVPFAALPHPGDAGGAAEPRPLVVDHEIVSLPSASVLAALRSELAGRQPPRGLVAVLADPVLAPGDGRLRDRPRLESPVPPLQRLPYTGREAEEILALAGSKRVLAASGFAASRELVKSGRLSGYRILHFATHGLFNGLHPELSALALSAFDASGRPADGQLRAYEISDLDLRADLVVLSACRTALGREVGGEGLVGLTQAFLHAGARRLIVSLWDVDDRSTGELMKRFYTALLRENLPPAQALRQAQISLWRETRWHAPYHWAGFVLQGEWH